MNFLRYALLCLLLPMLNANPLKIAEGDEFKSSATQNVYLYCADISTLPESTEGSKYKFFVYPYPKTTTDKPIGTIELAYDRSEKGVFMNALKINDCEGKQAYEVAAMVVAFKIFVNKLASGSFDGFLTLLPDSEQNFLNLLNAMGFKPTSGAIFQNWTLMKLTVKDFLEKYPKPVQSENPSPVTADSSDTSE